MALKEDLVRLYQLQCADSELARQEQELAALDNGAKAVRRAHEAEAALKAAEQAVHEAQGKLKDRELAVESTEADRAAKSKRAYGGTVSDSKELAALERKVDELARRKAKLEEEVLALYETVEQARKARAEAQQRAEEYVKRAKRARAYFHHRTKELQEQTEALRQQRPALAAQVPPALLKEYEDLRTHHEGVAVAAIVESACAFCRTRTPNEGLYEATKGLRMVHCEACGRILVPRD
ncbi:MAG TPA: hypothetical protein VGM19_03940 [Armatimonadota bacterium]|jgi:hypothetical protein